MRERYLAYLQAEKAASPHTLAAYESDLRQLDHWLLGPQAEQRGESVDYASVSLSDLRAWLAHLGDKGLSPRTMRRKALAVRSWFRYLLRQGVIKTNPAADIPLPKLPKPLPKLLKEEELEQSLSEDAFATDDWRQYRDSLIIELLYSTGLRRSELLSLHDSDIQHSSAQLRVMGKRSKVRLVPLASLLCAHIERYRQLRDAAFGCNSGAWGGPFICSDKGRVMNNTTLRRIVNIKLSGVSGRKTPHTLRHTFATALLRDGAEINSVKELLGHSSLATTQVYTHLSFSELQHNYKLAHPRAEKK